MLEAETGRPTALVDRGSHGGGDGAGWPREVGGGSRGGGVFFWVVVGPLGSGRSVSMK